MSERWHRDVFFLTHFKIILEDKGASFFFLTSLIINHSMVCHKDTVSFKSQTFLCAL